MKIKEIHLAKVKIYRDNNEIYSGNVEEVPNDLKNTDIKSIHFDTKDLIIEI